MMMARLTIVFRTFLKTGPFPGKKVLMYHESWEAERRRRQSKPPQRSSYTAQYWLFSPVDGGCRRCPPRPHPKHCNLAPTA